MKNPKIGKLLKGFSTLKEFKENPIGFLFDLLLAAVISALIPIPFVGAVVVRYKGMILFGIAGALLLGIGLILTILLFLTSPFTLSLVRTGNISSTAIGSLQNYIESGFSDTDIPEKNPFGGTGMENTITTVNFGETEDLTINGKPYHGVEEGIDLVPNNYYFLTIKAAKLSGEPIIFDTLTGTTYTYTDTSGALIVEVTNNAGTIKTVYIHLQQFLVNSGQQIHPGQPIGVMGSTGNSTGPHLEYQVRLNQGGSWVAVNPMDYIH